MTANVWSPNLKSIITLLAEMQPLKRKTLLQDQKFLQSSKLSLQEQQLVNNVFAKSGQATIESIWV
jgi:hypothetical protein